MKHGRGCFSLSTNGNSDPTIELETVVCIGVIEGVIVLCCDEGCNDVNCAPVVVIHVSEVET